ncbi:hypothetical protein DITRI_Ditri11bG0010300 [Diplodiscus trichospermus]
MAIEFCAGETIPRVSFSHDFCSSMQQYYRPLPSASMSLNSSIDFEFDVGIENNDQECYYSSADELFSNGKILPLQIRKKISPPKQQLHPPTQNPKLKLEMLPQSKSSGYKLRLCPPSTSLSRSSSTGSAPKVKPGQFLKQDHAIGNHRQNHQKDRSSCPCLHSSTNKQNTPFKKNFAYGSHGNGVAINPILNVPSVDVFCLSSIFLTGKDKKK